MMLWYTARGAGLAMLVILTATTTLGVTASLRRPAASRVVIQYVHRTLAVMGLMLLTLHVGSILVDKKAAVGVVGVLVPFASSYRPGAVALGSIAGYLFVLVTALGLARGRLAHSYRAVRIWRGLHGMSSSAG